jgi:hypothetical protein
MTWYWSGWRESRGNVFNLERNVVEAVVESSNRRKRNLPTLVLAGTLCFGEKKKKALCRSNTLLLSRMPTADTIHCTTKHTTNYTTEQTSKHTTLSRGT